MSITSRRNRDRIAGSRNRSLERSSPPFFRSLLELDHVMQNNQHLPDLRRSERELCSEISRQLQPFVSKIRYYHRLRRAFSRAPRASENRIPDYLLDENEERLPRSRNHRHRHVRHRVVVLPTRALPAGSLESKRSERSERSERRRPNLFDLSQSISNLLDYNFSNFMTGISVGNLVNQRGTPPSRPETKTAVLEHLTFRPSEDMDLDAKQCGICRDEFTEGQNIVKTSCCNTKFMHLNCSVQCLRHSQLCPFCRGAEIGYS